MTIDINELRRLMQDFKLAGSPMLVQTAQMSELLDRLEAAEKSDAESIAMYRKARDERDALRAENAALVDDMNLLRNNNTALRSKIEAAENDAAHQKALAASALRVAEGWERKCGELRAKVAEMGQQEPVGVLHVGSYYGEGGYDYRSYEDNENYKLGWDARNPNHIGWVEPLYALPGAQPAPSVPREAIEKMLTQLMDIAVSNGANSIPMPDEYVEVAAWLCGIPAQPAPSVPDGFSREDLEAVADGLDGYEKTVNVGNVTGGGDDHLESTTAYAARFIRAMLAAAPEAKP